MGEFDIGKIVIICVLISLCLFSSLLCIFLVLCLFLCFVVINDVNGRMELKSGLKEEFSEKAINLEGSGLTLHRWPTEMTRIESWHHSVKYQANIRFFLI